MRQGKDTSAKLGDPLKKAREGVYKQLDGLLRQLGDTKAAPHACCIAELCLFAFSREQAAQGISSSLSPLRTVLKLRLAPLLADRCGHAPTFMHANCPACLTPKPLTAQWFHCAAQMVDLIALDQTLNRVLQNGLLLGHAWQTVMWTARTSGRCFRGLCPSA